MQAQKITNNTLIFMIPNDNIYDNLKQMVLYSTIWRVLLDVSKL